MTDAPCHTIRPSRQISAPTAWATASKPPIGYTNRLQPRKSPDRPTSGRHGPHLSTLTVAYRWIRAKDPFEGVWGDVLVWLQAEPDATGKGLMARLQAEHPDRFSEAQLRTMQCRVKEWRGIMAKDLVYSGTSASSTEPDGLPELALIGVDTR